MVPLIAALGIGGVAYVAWTSLKKHMAEIEAEERRKAEGPRASGELERDEETGRYRPKK